MSHDDPLKEDGISGKGLVVVVLFLLIVLGCVASGNLSCS